MSKEFYDDSSVAFDNAIEQKQLSIDPENNWYAGRYMYMYSTQSDSNQIRDYFKNKNTREYDVVGLRPDVADECLKLAARVETFLKGERTILDAEPYRLMQTCVDTLKRVIPERLKDSPARPIPR